jgi:hypothetical protein
LLLAATATVEQLQERPLCRTEKVKIDSPRGPWVSGAIRHYLRVEGNNQVIGVAWKAAAKSARGCKWRA